MPYSDVLEPGIVLEAVLPRGIKPRPESLDSGYECSLDHLRELHRLVEAEEQDSYGYVFDDSCLRVI